MSFSAAHLNVRCLISHFSDLADLVRCYKFDLMALTETCLRTEHDSGTLLLRDYSLFRADRRSRFLSRGRGAVMYVKSSLHCINIFDAITDNYFHDSLLHVAGVLISNKHKRIAVLAVYRPPNCPLSCTGFVTAA